MAEPKTKPTTTTFSTYLAGITDEARRAECTTLAAMMTRATGESPCIWGTGIVGFGEYHYRYASGQEGDWPLVAFASRKTDISVYLMPGYDSGEAKAWLSTLGPHKRLAAVDEASLAALIDWSVAEMRRRYPPAVSGPDAAPSR
jgi:hypothetical protein